MPFKKNSYFDSVNIGTIPCSTTGKKRIFEIIHCRTTVEYKETSPEARISFEWDTWQL